MKTLAKSGVGTKGRFRELRRRLAVKIAEQGFTSREVAEMLDCSESAVDEWRRKTRRFGMQALVEKPHPGRPCKLSTPQRAELLEMIKNGAVAAGFSSELWTCPRVRRLILQKFGVSYHVDYLPQFLRGLGLSPQKPVVRPRPRDDKAIRRWRNRTWPRLKKGDAGSKLAS